MSFYHQPPCLYVYGSNPWLLFFHKRWALLSFIFLLKRSKCMFWTAKNAILYIAFDYYVAYLSCSHSNPWAHAQMYNKLCISECSDVVHVLHHKCMCLYWDIHNKSFQSSFIFKRIVFCTLILKWTCFCEFHPIIESLYMKEETCHECNVVGPLGASWSANMHHKSCTLMHLNIMQNVCVQSVCVCVIKHHIYHDL